MSKNLSLEDARNELTSNFAHKLADYEDSAIYSYVMGSINILEKKGEDISQWALVRIENPMEYSKESIRLTSQWRIVPLETLTNAGVAGED